SLMLQWCEPLDAALAEVRRVLRPDGFFAFSTFGPDTLHELRSAWAEADDFNHVNAFHDLHEVGDALVRAGLTEPVLDVDAIEVGYPDTLKLMSDAYEALRHDARLPATFEVIYGACWGAAGRRAAPAIGGVARIAPGSIGRAGRP